MRIVVPVTPAAECSPNVRCHWGDRARAVKQLRTAAKYSAIGADTLSGPVLVRTLIAWEPRRRILDGDNALACCKALYDGLQDAGVIENDKQCRYEPVVQIRDKDKRGYTVIEVEAIPEAGAGGG